MELGTLRKPFVLTSITATLGAIAAAPGLLAQPGRTADDAPPDGRRIYEEACAACHGPDGRGRPSTQVGFDVPLPDFTDCDFATREPNADWLSIAHEGGPVRGFNRMMPAFGDALSDEELDAVIERLRLFCENDDWPRGELNLPRALFTEKAYPEDEAVITTSLVTEGNDSLTHKFTYEQRFGTRNQMELSLPVTRADLGAADGWKTGAGDLAVAVKHVVSHSFEKGSIFSIGGELVLPTGSEADGFGGGTSVLEPYLAYGKMLGTDSFFQLQSFAELPRDRALEDEFGVRAVIGRSFATGGGFGRVWTPMIEVLGGRELASGAQTDWDVVPQFQVTLNQRQHIMASAGVRVPANNRSERDKEFVFYLLWDWFDGGVLEGW